MEFDTIENVFLYKELFSTFIKRKPEIPLCQRSYIEERINHFYNYIITKQNDGKLPYIGLLHCARYSNNINDYTFYILDGQHRYYAYKKYYETFNKDFYIQYVVKICYKKEDIVQFFKSLNDNYNLHEIILDNFDKADIIKKYIQEKYHKHISNSENPHYPNINLDQVTKYIIDLFNNSSNIIDSFEKLNNDIYESIKNNTKYNKTKQGLYIGYVFIKSENENKRKKIPITVRHKLWCDYFNETTIGKCYVCSKKIDNSNFHAGHKISCKNGGSDNISNLVPVCSCCNLSMGSQNLEDFKLKYF